MQIIFCSPSNAYAQKSYDVDTSPKMALEPAPTETTEPTEPTTEPTLSQTGQPDWPVSVLAVSGLMIFTLVWFLKQSERKEEL